MKIKAIAASVAAAATMALAATSASAATEFGSTCSGELSSGTDLTMMTVGGPSAGAPSGGVITQLKVTNSEEIPFQIPFTVKALRPAGGNQYTNVGQDSVMVGTGTAIKETRISVQAGDKLGLHAQPVVYEGVPIPPLYLYCAPVEGSILGYTEGDPAVGSTAAFTEIPGGAAPVVARLEPDADGDGYGDETQDKCPQSAAVQVECPVVILDSFVLPKKSSIVVVVGTSTAAPVTVSASAKLPSGKKAKASAVAKLKKVTHNVTPGKLRYFSLKYPANLKQALADLAPGKKLKLKITASAKNVAGQVSKDKTTVKLG